MPANDESHEVETFECACCLNDCEVIDDEQPVDVQGDDLCSSCYNNSVAECSACDQEYRINDLRERDGSYYCPECFDECFFTCSNCGEVEPANESVRVSDGEDICQDCYEHEYTTCEGCSEVYPTDTIMWIDDYPYCEECRYENFYRCDSCHEYVRNDDACWDDDGDQCYCPSCYDNMGSGTIHNYSYRPCLKFYHLPSEVRAKRPLYFGVETEIECKDNVRNDASDIADADERELFYLKHDGSINYGFEIVSHPFTYLWMIKNRDAFEPMFDLRKKGATSYNNSTCGMHVHMSKDAFTHMQMLKFIRMFYDFPSFTFKISRRTQNRMDCYANLTKPEDFMYIARHGGSRRYGRGALNFSNDSTIECRIFRGTLNPIGWFANIEYLQSLFEYCTSHGMSEITPAKYLAWMRDRADKYTNFHRVHMPRLGAVESAERVA